MFYLIINVLVFISCADFATKICWTHASENVPSSAVPFNWNLSDSTVEEKMVKLGIIPHIIPQLPQTIVDISYKHHLRSVYLQNRGDDTIPHHKLSNRPVMYFNDCDPRRLYSLIMTFVNVTQDGEEFNPDCLKNAKQYHNMLYTNIEYCNMRRADEVFKYEPPPPNDNNETRIYVFLLMEQRGGKIYMGFKEKYNLYFFRDEQHHNSYRSNFTIKEFIEHFETDLVAGNYMRVVSLPEKESFLYKYCPYNYFSSFSNRLKNSF